MKKIGILLATLLWISTAVKYIAASFLKDTDVLTAFQALEYSSAEASLVAYGNYKGSFDEEKRNSVAKNIISMLGIMPPYEIKNANDGKKSFTACEKKSANGSVKVELVNADNKTQIGISVNLKNNLSSLYDYRELVEEIFDAEGVEGKVNMYLEGRMDGALNYEERSHAADTLLKKLDAKIVSENRDSNIFTVYAYTDKIPDYVKSLGRKINVNVSAEYDETRNETVIYLASPINNLDY